MASVCAGPSASVSGDGVGEVWGAVTIDSASPVKTLACGGPSVLSTATDGVVVSVGVSVAVSVVVAVVVAVVVHVGVHVGVGRLDVFSGDCGGVCCCVGSVTAPDWGVGAPIIGLGVGVIVGVGWVVAVATIGVGVHVHVHVGVGDG